MTRSLAVKSLAFMVFWICSPAFAQDAPSPAAQAFTASPGTQAMLDRVFGLTPLMNQIEANNPDMDEATRLLVARIASEEQDGSRPAFEEAMALAAQRTFSEAELTALTEFLSTEVGAGVLAKMQPMLQMLFSESRPELRAMEARIQERVDAALSDN